MKGKAKFKISGGNPVLLCSECSTVIKYSRYFTEEEWQAARGEIKLDSQYCDECEEKRRKAKERKK